MEDYDKTMQKILDNIGKSKHKREEQKYLNSVEKLKRQNHTMRKEDKENIPINMNDTNQRIFRESSRDFFGSEFNDVLTENDVSTAIDTYLESDLSSDKFSYDLLLSNLKLEDRISSEEDQSNNEARAIIQK